MMNRLEKKICANYATRSGNELLLSASKEEIVAMCLSLCHQIFNDKNSGHFRERVTLDLLGLTQSIGKHGYDSTTDNYEVKPTNVANHGKRKLNGQGTITDHRWQRHKKFMEDNMKLLISGWVDGQILYIIEVNYKDICGHFESLLMRHFPDGDVKNKYVRSANFSYKHYRGAHQMRWMCDVEVLTARRTAITQELYDDLLTHANNK